MRRTGSKCGLMHKINCRLSAKKKHSYLIMTFYTHPIRTRILRKMPPRWILRSNKWMLHKINFPKYNQWVRKHIRLSMAVFWNGVMLNLTHKRPLQKPNSRSTTYNCKALSCKKKKRRCLFKAHSRWSVRWKNLPKPPGQMRGLSQCWQSPNRPLRWERRYTKHFHLPLLFGMVLPGRWLQFRPLRP